MDKNKDVDGFTCVQYVVTEDSMRQLIKSFHPVGAQASMVHDEIKSSSFGLFDF